MALPEMPDGFWTGLFSFLGLTVTSVYGLIKFNADRRDRANEQKAKMELSVERFKATEAGKFVSKLEVAIDRIEPLVKLHGEQLAASGISVDSLREMQGLLLAMMKELKIQYGNYHSHLDNVKAGAGLVMEKVEKIETEIETLKGTGHIFVRNKK